MGRETHRNTTILQVRQASLGSIVTCSGHIDLVHFWWLAKLLRSPPPKQETQLPTCRRSHRPTQRIGTRSCTPPIPRVAPFSPVAFRFRVSTPAATWGNVGHVVLGASCPHFPRLRSRGLIEAMRSTWLSVLAEPPRR